MRVEVYDEIGGRLLGHAQHQFGEPQSKPGPDRPWPGDKLDGVPAVHKRYNPTNGTPWWFFQFPPNNAWADPTGQEHTIVWVKGSLE